MVDERITDGKRLAQLLASELTGLETGPLADVAVVDADPGVTPTPDGAEAYAIDHRGRHVGRVCVSPDEVEVRLDVAPRGIDPSALSVPAEERADGVVLSVESGAAVKRAVDAIRTLLAA
jgi:hypothetical protein